MKKLLLILIFAALVASCSKGDSSGGSYVAKIDNTTISKEDVQAEINSLPEMAKQFFQGPEGTSRFVDELVKKELLYLEAKKRGLDQDKNFRREVESIQKISLIRMLLKKEGETGLKITDKDIKDYYDSHKGDFIENSQVKISQIVVKTEDDAKKAHSRLKAGEDFGKVASDMSVDKTTAKAGGNLGSFKRGELAQELEEAVFSLKKGDISMPIRLKDGIHILKVADAKGIALDFEKVKGFIGQKLTEEKFEKFVENLKKSHKIDVNKEALAKMVQSPAAIPAPVAPKSAPAQK